MLDKRAFFTKTEVITLMKDMPSKVADAMYHQIQSRGYAAPVDVLMDIGVLEKKKYDDWRAAR